MKITEEQKMNDRIFEFVEFRVGSNLFGISITNVREIIQPVPVTTLPQASAYIKGIIQLRGEVLPLLDFGELTGSAKNEKGKEAKYIVIEFTDRTIAIEVDDVTQIERVNAAGIETASGIYEGQQVPLSGVIRRKDTIVLLVNFEKLMKDQFD